MESDNFKHEESNRQSSDNSLCLPQNYHEHFQSSGYDQRSQFQNFQVPENIHAPHNMHPYYGSSQQLSASYQSLYEGGRQIPGSTDSRSMVKDNAGSPDQFHYPIRAKIQSIFENIIPAPDIKQPVLGNRELPFQTSGSELEGMQQSSGIPLPISGAEFSAKDIYHAEPNSDDTQLISDSAQPPFTASHQIHDGTLPSSKKEETQVESIQSAPDISPQDMVVMESEPTFNHQSPENKHSPVCESPRPSVNIKREFETIQNLRNNKSLLKCNICKEGFHLLSSLSKHMLCHDLLRPFCCSYCEAAFGDVEELKVHISTHNVEMPFFCGICQESVVSSEQLQTHMKEDHGMDFSNEDGVSEEEKEILSHVAKDLRAVTARKRILNAMDENGERTVTQAIAQDSQPPSLSQKDHMPSCFVPLSDISKKKSGRNFSGKFGTSKTKLKTRNGNSADSQSLPSLCEFCCQVHPNIKKHQSSHPTKMLKTCGFCNVKLATKNAVSRHYIVVHKRKKNLVCKFCSLSVGSESNYIQHYLDAHQKDFANGVIMDCRELPRSEEPELETLMDDVPEGSIVHPSQFSVCEFCCEVHLNMKQHQCSHTDEELQKCGFCDIKLATKSSVSRHYILMHKKKKQFPCKICSEMFHSIHTYKKHFLQNHPNQATERLNIIFDEDDSKSKNAKIEMDRDQSSSDVTSSDDEPPSDVESKVPNTNNIRKSAKPLVCPFCCKVWPYLKRHQLQHDQATLTKCGFCGLTLATKNSVIRHYEAMHKARKNLDCKICKMEIGSERKYIEHLHNFHPLENGDFLDEWNTSKEPKASSMETSAGKDKQFTGVVEKGKSGSSDLKQKIQISSMSVCEFCRQVHFYIKRHRFKHSESTLNKCGFCDMILAGKTSVIRHYMKVHRDRNNLDCKICGKLIGSEEVYKRHYLKYHSTEYSDLIADDLSDMEGDIGGVKVENITSGTNFIGDGPYPSQNFEDNTAPNHMKVSFSDNSNSLPDVGNVSFTDDEDEVKNDRSGLDFSNSAQMFDRPDKQPIRTEYASNLQDNIVQQTRATVLLSEDSKPTIWDNLLSSAQDKSSKQTQNPDSTSSLNSSGNVFTISPIVGMPSEQSSGSFGNIQLAVNSLENQGSRNEYVKNSLGLKGREDPTGGSQTSGTLQDELPSRRPKSDGLETWRVQAKKIPNLQKLNICRFCGEVRINLKLHIRKHPREMLTKCGFCHQKCRGKQSVERHFQCVHVRKSDLVCSICHEFIGSVDNYKKHFMSNHVQSIHQSNSSDSEADNVHTPAAAERDDKTKLSICEFCCDLHTNIKKHRTSHPDTMQNTCGFCGVQLANRSTVIRHYQMKHKNKKNLDCKYCDRLIGSEKKYKKHFMKYHSKRSGNDKGFHSASDSEAEPAVHPCSHCDAKFSSTVKLRYHELKHTEKQLFCDICNKECYGEKQLDKHRKLQHNIDKPTTCQICGETLENSKLLRSHMAKHKKVKGDKCFICQYCAKNFSSSASLGIHIKRFHDINAKFKFECKICGKGYDSKSLLRCHVRVHSGEKPFMCEFCGRGFRVKITLQMHLNRHTGNRPYKCKQCEKSFKQLSTLQTHERQHTGAKPYVCQDCGKAFSDLSNFHSHRRSNHKNLLEPAVSTAPPTAAPMPLPPIAYNPFGGMGVPYNAFTQM